MLHRSGNFDERDLENDEGEEYRFDCSENDGQKKFVQEGAEQESNNLSNHFAFFPSDYYFQVYVSVEKQVHRFIPFSIELFIRC